jgi:hypothetical protein
MAFLKRALAAAVILLGAHALMAAPGSPDREHRVKAVFLFNFAQFVDWPDSAFSAQDDPLVVGILGEDPFNTYLDEVVRGEKVKDHPITVRRYKRIEDVKDCHILYISPSQSPIPAPMLNQLKARHILTVGESEDFFQRGGMVRFATENGKIRLKINLEEVQEADLMVSSKLLRLADVSGPVRERE